jgi:hypothetical protein
VLRDPFPFGDDDEVSPVRSSPGLRYAEALQFWLAANARTRARDDREVHVAEEAA